MIVLSVGLHNAIKLVTIIIVIIIRLTFHSGFSVDKEILINEIIICSPFGLGHCKDIIIVFQKMSQWLYKYTT